MEPNRKRLENISARNGFLWYKRTYIFVMTRYVCEYQYVFVSVSGSNGLLPSQEEIIRWKRSISADNKIVPDI